MGLKHHHPAILSSDAMDYQSHDLADTKRARSNVTRRASVIKRISSSQQIWLFSDQVGYMSMKIWRGACALPAFRDHGLQFLEGIAGSAGS